MPGLVEFFSFVPLVLAAAPLRVEVDGDCPAADRIHVELEAIVAARDGAPLASDSAQVVTRDGTLIVTLRGEDGAALGERRLRAEGDCDAQARAVAVILATFLTDLHPEYLTRLPATPAAAGESPTTAPSETEPPKPSPVAAPLPEQPRATSGPPASPKRPAPPTRVERESEWLLSASAGATLSSDLVPAASVSLSFVPGAHGLGVRTFVLVSGASGRELGGARASFSRYPLGAGPLLRFGDASAWFDAGAGAALGWLHVEGRTFATNLSDDDLIAGIYGSLRAGTAWLGLRPFIEIGALAWPGKSVLSSSVPDSRAELPVFEAHFLLGAGYAL